MSSLTSETAQRTAADVIGTETLSSRPMGTVSTAAATSAARNGAPREYHPYGGGITAGRHHHIRNAPATPPNSQKATEPATVLRGFHGQRRRPIRRPARVAIPSPAARMPQAP